MASRVSADFHLLALGRWRHKYFLMKFAYSCVRGRSRLPVCRVPFRWVAVAPERDPNAMRSGQRWPTSVGLSMVLDFPENVVCGPAGGAGGRLATIEDWQQICWPSIPT